MRRTAGPGTVAWPEYEPAGRWWWGCVGPCVGTCRAAAGGVGESSTVLVRTLLVGNVRMLQSSPSRLTICGITSGVPSVCPCENASKARAVSHGEQASVPDAQPLPLRLATAHPPLRGKRPWPGQRPTDKEFANVAASVANAATCHAARCDVIVAGGNGSVNGSVNDAQQNMPEVTR